MKALNTTSHLSTTKINNSVVRYTRILILITCLAFAGGNLHINTGVNAASTAQEIWGPPVNLSKSGAASQPRIFTAPGNTLQAFWIDRFDGMMTALFNGEAWSLPAQSLVLPPANRLGVAPAPFTSLPAQIFADTMGRLHAYYYGTPDQVNKNAPLLHAQLKLGTTTWQNEVQVAESASAFTSIQTNDQEIKLFYLRTYKNPPNILTQDNEPGLYLRSTAYSTSFWNPSQLLFTSPYYRVITGEQIALQAASTGQEIILMWKEPRLDRMVTATSMDLGKTWNDPQPVELPGKPTGLVMANLPDGQLLRIWQDSTQPGCVLYQQTYIPNMSKSSTVPTATPPVGSSLIPGTWSVSQRIMEQVSNCPVNNRFLIRNDRVYWVWGEGTDTLTISTWDASQAVWSLPQTYRFSFQDPDTERFMQLDDLHVTISGEKLAVIGVDRASGDTWTVSTLVSALEITYAPPSPWTFPVQVSDARQQASRPTIGIDQQGYIHVVWNQGSILPGRSLYYARLDANGLSSAIEIIRSTESEIVDQPNLLIDSNDLIHLIWVSGSVGQLSYSRARTSEAASPSGWLPAQIISQKPNTAWPQIARDGKGIIYIVYAVRVNEGRGLYMVYSQDDGDSWSEPQLIFDAVAAGWESISHPTLQITPDGNLHIAFVHSNLSGAPITEVFYIRTRVPLLFSSEGQNLELIQPIKLGDQGADWPRLAWVGGQLHLLYISPAGLEQRWVLLAEQTSDGLGWTSANRVPEWEKLGMTLDEVTRNSLAVQHYPYALIFDSSNLHLVAPIHGQQTLQYSIWNVSPSDASSGIWRAQEQYSPLGMWVNHSGVAAATTMSGGKLALTWIARPISSQTGSESDSLPGIFVSIREIGRVAAQTTPVVLPTSTLSLSPTVKATEIPQPTATLASNLPPPSGNEVLSPLVLGAGLAAFIVVLIFAGILLRGKR